ncbi:ABC transporter permease [Legionella londiniensis]|uniref:Transport permease protein n=1 Tax=Legionella londiniensis TaxID=45068 RepID=A0A0W0VTM3_9GAMM|nr:ABC transporter permease [Legionella londiniensis]KTD23333.1 ABC transporter permease [Legionella londiniensis]STX94112.1 ABC transporter permease [Legionella londiniensis]
MNIKQLIALYTLVRNEIVRLFRIFNQVFFPPIITTFLYFLIFGSIIGERIGSIQGVSYSQFIAPGLIMMTVITNAYSNISTSLFNMRFQKSIEEMLVSPMHYSLILTGFTLTGILRGILVATLVFLVSFLFVDIDLTILPATLGVVALVSALFAQAGFTNGLLARNFDEIAIIPTFILTPLTYLGGVFYDTAMLPSFWKEASLFNPIFYMVNALRQVMTAQQFLNLPLALSLIVLMLVLMIVMNLFLLKQGVGIRE